ncbi:hypothetical protein Q1695_001992 [Nippostrongylus brasiliensis]|nr:hypothetical protein Q1695_001992 [Nippostrongylus brasiliensis]
MRLQTGESTHLRAVAIDHTQAWLGLTVVRSSVEGGALGAGALPRVTLTADQGHPYLLSLHALSAAACPARSLLGDALFPPRSNQPQQSSDRDGTAPDELLPDAQRRRVGVPGRSRHRSEPRSTAASSIHQMVLPRRARL